MVTSDHGMTPLPGQLMADGCEAGVVVTGPVEEDPDRENVKDRIEAELAGEYGVEEWVLSVPYPSVKLNIEAAERRGIDTEQVIERARSALLGIRGVDRVVTRAELSSEKGSTSDSLWIALRKWFVPDRSGELVVSLRPHTIWSSPSYAARGGTNHGSISDDDSRIPLVFYGSGVSQSVREDPACLADVTPSLLELMNVGTETIFDGKSLF